MCGSPLPMWRAAPTAAAMVILVNDGDKALNETVFYRLLPKIFEASLG